MISRDHTCQWTVCRSNKALEARGSSTWQRRLFVATLGVVAGILGVPDIASACDLVLLKAPDVVTIQYDPFAVANQAGTAIFEFENRADVECSATMKLTEDAGNPFRSTTLGGVEIDLKPLDASGPLRQATEPGTFVFTVAAQGRFKAELQATVIKDAVAEAGDYSTRVLVDVVSSDSRKAADQAPIVVKLVTPRRAQMNIAGAAGAFGSGLSVTEINFGILETGKTRRIFLQVRANSRHDLTFSSENGGFMKNVTLKEGADPIPYSLVLDGTTIDLSSAAVHSLDPPRTAEGTSLSLDFIVGNVRSPPGRYEDLLTIDIKPG